MILLLLLLLVAVEGASFGGRIRESERPWSSRERGVVHLAHVVRDWIVNYNEQFFAI